MRVLAWPLDSTRGNPYTRLLYDHLAARGVTVDAFAPGRVLTGGYDVWHVHWPDGAFNRPQRWRAFAGVHGLLTLLAVARLRGIRVVWTAHNVGGHEARHPALERWFWDVFTRRLDGVISLSAAGVDALRGALPALARVPTFVVPHGHYRAAYPAPVPRAAARRALGLPPGAPVALHFGVLRPYKNVVRLVEAFRAMDPPEGAGAAPVLLVAGKPETDALAQAVQAAADGAACVRLDLRFIPDEAVPRYLGAADLVALPYAEILNSGTALLALSLNRPVLVPDRGAMGELRRHVGAAWVRTYAPPLTPATLAEALAWARHADRPVRPDLAALDWDRLAAATHAAFEAVCGEAVCGEAACGEAAAR